MAAEGKGRQRLQTALGVAILLVLSSLGWVLWSNYSAEELLPEIIENLPENVDLGLDRVHYSQNENGKKSWSLDADRANYQRKEEELALTGVELVFYDTGHFGTLHLTADTGTLDQKQELIDVQGDVRIVTENGEQFQSESLRYDFSRRLITTRDPVHMQGKQLEMTGVGMKLDLVQGTMQLKNNVHALLDEKSFQGAPQ